MAEMVALRHPDWSIDAVDLDEEVVALGAASIERCGIENVRVLQADLTKPIGDRAYDAVLALECLTLIPDDRAALRSLANALREDGLLVVHVQEKDWKPVLRRSSPIWQGEVRHGYAREEIVEMIEEAGLTVKSLKPTTRGVARLGRELGQRSAARSLKARVLLYPLLLATARLDRIGLTWGPAGGFFIEARRLAATPAGARRARPVPG